MGSLPLLSFKAPGSVKNLVRIIRSSGYRKIFQKDQTPAAKPPNRVKGERIDCQAVYDCSSSLTMSLKMMSSFRATVVNPSPHHEYDQPQSTLKMDEGFSLQETAA